MRSILKYSRYLSAKDQDKEFRDFMLIALLAGLPCLGVSICAWGPRILLMLLVAWLPGMFIEIAFSRSGKKRYHTGSLVFSILLVLMLPHTTPLWLIFLASAFSILFAQEIFGGPGYHLVNPVLLAKLFLMLGYLPGIQGPSFSSALDPSRPQLWIIAGLLMLLPLQLNFISQKKNLLIFVGFHIGAALALAWMYFMDLMPYNSITRTLVLDNYAFVTCFIIFDPACRPHSRWGLIIYGFLVASLGLIFGIFSDKFQEGIIIAALLGNILSPLLDAIFPGVKTAGI